jgi:hypothetical protein
MLEIKNQEEKKRKQSKSLLNGIINIEIPKFNIHNPPVELINIATLINKLLLHCNSKPTHKKVNINKIIPNNLLNPEENRDILK